MRTDGQTDMTKLIVAFRKSANAPTKAKQDSAKFQLVTAGRNTLQKMMHFEVPRLITWYRGAEKSLARPTSRCILFDGENISYDASLVIYINNTIIPPVMIINKIYEHQNLLSL